MGVARGMLPNFAAVQFLFISLDPHDSEYLLM